MKEFENIKRLKASLAGTGQMGGQIILHVGARSKKSGLSMQ